jgi:hypothetical protein
MRYVIRRTPACPEVMPSPNDRVGGYPAISAEDGDSPRTQSVERSPRSGDCSIINEEVRTVVEQAGKLVITDQAVVPAHVILAPGEEVVSSSAFMVSNLLFFLKVRMAVTNKRLVGEAPNTLFGIIPLGSRRVAYPLSNITGVAAATRFSAPSVLIAAVLLLLGVTAGNIILILVGVVAALRSVRTVIEVVNAGGQRMGHDISVFDQSRAMAFAEHINAVLANRQ